MEQLQIIMKSINKINSNRYFTILSKTSIIIKEKFLQSQECLISAIDGLNNSLVNSLLIAPNDKEKLVLVENLYNKYGNGDINKSHANIFIKLLQSLGYKREIKLHNISLPSYRIIAKFNSLLDHGTSFSWIYSLAVLGMIEYISIDINTNIHNYLKSILPLEQININEKLNTKYYTDLIGLLVPYINSGQCDVNEIVAGFTFGYNIMNDMYNDLSYFLCLKNPK